MSHKSSKYLALGGVLLLLVLYGITNIGLLGDNPVGSTSRDTSPLIVPAGYAFAIWGPIYLGLIAFPVYQLIKGREDHPAWIPLRQWYTFNVIANGVWLAFASYSWQWLTVVVIIAMLISLFQINTLLLKIKADGADYNYWLERLVFSLYFAWITLATALNISSALAFYEWGGWGISEIRWTMIISVVAALIAGATALKYRDAAYAGVVIWAFSALAVRHYPDIDSLAYLALAIAASFLLIAISILRKRELGARS